MKTTYEKQFYDQHINDHIYCVEQPEKVFLKGIRDSAVHKVEHTYIVYEVLKCQDKNRARTDEKVNRYCQDPSDPEKDKCERKLALLPNGDPVDPKCESNENINDWMKDMSIHFRVLNDKMDFSKWEGDHIRQNEIWLPTIPMTPGKFTDSGYRFRENRFNNAFNVLPGGPVSRDKFYDVFFFSSDTLSVGLDHPVVAEMYFRVSVDEIIHSRIVYKLMDWLGALGGVEKILIKVIKLIAGGFLQFHSAVTTFDIQNKSDRNKKRRKSG